MSQVAERSLLRLLPWDSAFFGVTIAQVDQAHLAPEDVEQLLAESRRVAVHCLYFEADPLDTATVQNVQREGFTLVDTRVVLRRCAGEQCCANERAVVEQASNAEIELGTFVESDLEDLRVIAADVAHWSRFACDARFGMTASLRLYDAWLERSRQGDVAAFFVARRAGRPVGFATLTRNGDLAQMPLIGVDPAMRGAGIGRRLMQAVVDWSAAQGVAATEIVTQARNVQALRLYVRSGFLPNRVTYYFHKWLE